MVLRARRQREGMRGRICLVTGAGAGIGRATALGLARMGATVGLVVRDRERGERTVAELRRESANEDHCLFVADLASGAAVRELASRVTAAFPHLHVLVNNAGIVCPKRELTSDGTERTFAVNHLAPFLLTRLLLDLLRSAPSARVVTVASQVHSPSLDFDNLQGQRRYAGLDAYRRSKLANILFTKELARRLVGGSVTANCLHPGVVDTRLLSDFGSAERLERGDAPIEADSRPGWRRAAGAVVGRVRRTLDPNRPLTPEEGARTSVFVATAPELQTVSGEYFVSSRPATPKPVALDREVAQRLWSVSAALAGLPDAP